MTNDKPVKKVLITGAAGFIGSHLVDHFLSLDYQVVGVDNLLTGSLENLKHLDQTNFQFINADVIQPPDAYLPSGFVPDLILHFASPASPVQYQKYPVETYLVNSYATHLLLTYLKEKAPKSRLVFAGTSEAYGDPEEHPQKETYWGHVNPNGIRSCYDESKRLGETICGVFERNFDLDVRIVRIFNTYGPRMAKDDGRVIPQFISEALALKPLSIQGDGTQTRSYCYVSDLVAGIVQMATLDQLKGQTINLGNPEEYTILETAEIISALSHGSKELNFLPLPDDDPTRRKPDITKAKQLLNWSPQIDFTTGLKLTIDYFKQK